MATIVLLSTTKTVLLSGVRLVEELSRGWIVGSLASRASVAADTTPPPTLRERVCTDRDDERRDETISSRSSLVVDNSW